jgi:CzcA family heavy metal efflux pump
VNGLIRWSIRYRNVVATLAIIWLVVGAAVAWRAPLDVFPEFVPPQADIQTECPGFAPEQVEQNVTRVIEAAVNGTTGLATLRSDSVFGLSVITLTFEEKADPYIVRQGIAERLATLSGTLPPGVEQPKLSPLTSSTMDVLKLGLVSDTVDPFELRDIADWVLKPRLLSVPGVARVNVFGGAVRQVQIQPRLDRLTALGLTIADVVNASRQAVAQRGAGFVDTGPQRVTLAAAALTPDPRVLARTIVTIQNNVPIRLGDMALVTIGPGLQVGDAVIQGRKGVLLTISGQYGANTLAVTRSAEAVLAELTPTLEERGITIFPALHRPATFIERALANIGASLALGGCLILIVLYLFLRNVRAAVISFLAIPLSLFTAIAVLVAMGQTINTLTLGGFAVALGVLVDDAIIDVQNIIYRLRQATNAERTEKLKIIEDSSIEIRGAMIYGTLAVVLVFIPIIFFGGVQGRFLMPMALAFILAVLASLIIAVTVTPALAAFLLRDSARIGEPRWIGWLRRGHIRLMRLVHRIWFVVVALLIVGVGAAAYRLPFLKSEYLPQFREGHFVLQVSTRTAGTSLDEMAVLGERISTALLKLPFIATVEQQIGRAETGEDTWPPDRSEFHVELRERHQETEEEAEEQIRQVLQRFPEIKSETVTFLGDRISESITGETGQAVIKISGNDLPVIEQVASKIGTALATVPGLADLEVPETQGAPTLAVTLDYGRLTSYGLTEQDAADALQAAFTGATVGQTYDGAKTVDVVVLLPPSVRNRLDALDRLMIGNEGTRVLLRNVASISPTTGRSIIHRESGQRQVAVSFNAAGRPLQDVVRDARARVSEVQLPKDIYVTFVGEAEAERASQLRLAMLTSITIALIILVLTMAFRRSRLAILVLVNVPFCLLGGVAAIEIANIGLTLGSLVGLVTVFGIGARNSIMLLSHAEHLIDREGLPASRETFERAADERLVPVLMTALMAALGLIPLALGIGRVGHEIEAPMAIAVLGGLASATLLNLVALPELLVRLQRRLGFA